MPEEEKKKAIAEFNFRKGIVVATFCGILSACFSFGLTAAAPIGVASAACGTGTFWTGLPKLVVVLLGGFTTNFIWCLVLNLKNRTGYQYFSKECRPEHAHESGAGGSEHGGGAAQKGSASSDLRIPILRNYLFCILAGVTWYFQFFFYTMGESRMGSFSFASWTLHMASIIIFSTIWGWTFHEWRGASKKAHALIGAGVALLILSTVVIGIGTWMKGAGTPH
jgi:L-rhamnose-H+ transport protein